MRGRLGPLAVLIAMVAVGGCAVASEEGAGAGVDGIPVVVGRCAEDVPDCDDTAVIDESGTSTVGDTTSTADTSTTMATTTMQPMELQTIGVAFTTDAGACDDEVVLFDRQIDASRDPILATFEGVVAGPFDEEKVLGAASFFSADTAEMVASAAVSGAMLVVDFGDLRSLIPNASTTCGSMALLTQLNTTAFQFEDIERVRYQIEGSCDTFANWLQRGCMEYTRDGALPAQP